ncbi:MAG TPA: PAS domain S-box protein, partial [bacterium]|nr:PAS domain S-box protein [bacterium]
MALKLSTRLSLTMYLSLGLLAACAALLLMVNNAQNEALQREQNAQLALARVQTLLADAATGSVRDWPDAGRHLVNELQQLDLPATVQETLRTAGTNLAGNVAQAGERVRTLRSMTDVLNEARQLANERFAGESIALGQLIILFNLLVILALIANAYVMRHTVLQPLAEMQSGLEQLALGRYEHRVKVAGSDELAALGVAFNAMAARLHDSSRSLVRDNFARARAVEEVRLSEERWHRMAAASFEGIMLVVDGLVVDANEQAEKLFGVEAGALLQASVDDLLLPPDEDIRLEPLPAGVADAQRHRLRRPDGSERQVETRQQSNLQHNGRPACVLVLRDVTAEAALRRQLVDTLTFTREVIAASPLGILVFGYDGRCRSANPAAAHMLDVAQPDLLLATGAECIAPPLRRRLQLFARRAMRADRELRRELHFRATRGECWLEVRIIPFREGGREYLLAILEDSTVRRNMLQQMHESEARFRALVEHVPAVTYLTTLDEPPEIQYVSPQIKLLLGCDPEEFCANPRAWHDWMHPADRALGARRQIVERGGQITSEYRMCSRSGQTVWVRDVASVIRADNGEPLFLQGLLYDITAAKEQEQRLQRAYAVLEETQDLVIVFGRDRQLLFANRAVRALCDGAEGAAFVQKFRSMQTAETLAMLGQTAMPAARRDGAWAGELTLCGSGGVAIPVLLTIQAHNAGDESLTYYAIIARDISAIKHLEQARAQSEATQAIINAQPDGLLVARPDGTVIAANPAFAAMVGHPLERIIGATLHQIIATMVYPDDRAMSLANVGKLMSGADPEPHAMALLRADG